MIFAANVQSIVKGECLKMILIITFVDMYKNTHVSRNKNYV